MMTASKSTANSNRPTTRPTFTPFLLSEMNLLKEIKRLLLDKLEENFERQESQLCLPNKLNVMDLLIVPPRFLASQVY